jgi:puromycin-sensitive aminopeptidase
LSREAIPIDYDIDIEASPRRKTFAGTLVLSARVVKPCQSFEIHARDLRVRDVKLRVGGRYVKGHVVTHPQRQTIELTFGMPLPRARILIRMSFRGSLSPAMHALYLARDGADRAIVSQCEATDARAIFPCFDEPDLKATFRWTVRTNPGLEVITNGALLGRRQVGGRAIHRFARTRPMSTYLAALAIGRFDSTKRETIARVPCRILCVRGKVGQTDFARAVTARVLPWYERYFGHRYAFGKLDQVAVPGFDAGAMENVGAVFYRQSTLLMQPGATSWSAQKRIAEVIAHELAHMWFGNLVTMKWWDDLWLNEAFATWIAYKAVDAWKPDWRMWDDSLEAAQAALAADALIHTHPVYTEVNSPAEAIELFDVITYEKGCAVLRMIERYLGEEVFAAGIRAYITRHKSGNATRSDLWDALTAASGEPVDTLMEGWIGRPGFPLIHLSKSARNGEHTLHLRQRRFFANPEAMRESEDTLWSIPLVIKYATATRTHTRRILLNTPETTVTLASDTAVRWCCPNADAAGFFRVQLDDPLLDELLEAGRGALTPAERTRLLDDQWALMRAGSLTTGRYLDVLAAYRGDSDFLVTRCVASQLTYLDNFVVARAQRPHFAAFTRWLFAEQLSELGWQSADGEPPERALQRATVIGTLGAIGRRSDVLAEAKRLQALEQRDPTAVAPDLAPVVIGLTALQGDHSQLDRFVEVFAERRRKRAAPELQARYLAALGRFEDRSAVEHALQLCVDGTVPQDQLLAILRPLLSNRRTHRIAWSFVKGHWSTIGSTVGAMGIARLVESLGSLPVDLQDDVAAFFARHPVAEATRALQKALEAMDLRRALLERATPALSTWLRHHGYAGVSRQG